jgi:hypothetical protein
LNKKTGQPLDDGWPGDNQAKALLKLEYTAIFNISTGTAQHNSELPRRSQPLAFFYVIIRKSHFIQRQQYRFTLAWC